MYCGIFVQGRKWGAAVGYVGRTVVLAGGGDYGDDTIEVSVNQLFTMKLYVRP